MNHSSLISRGKQIGVGYIPGVILAISLLCKEGPCVSLGICWGLTMVDGDGEGTWTLFPHEFLDVQIFLSIAPWFLATLLLWNRDCDTLLMLLGNSAFPSHFFIFATFYTTIF